jgi:RNA-directed DNA polymerase
MRDLALRHLHPFRGTGHPAVNAALRNHYFDSIGLPRLYVPVSA